MCDCGAVPEELEIAVLFLQWKNEELFLKRKSSVTLVMKRVGLYFDEDENEEAFNWKMKHEEIVAEERLVVRCCYLCSPVFTVQGG